MALLNGRQWYQLYTIDWCKDRGYDWLEFKKEALDPDYNGECYASFREFLDWEYEDKEYMQYLYDHKDELLRYADCELVEKRSACGKGKKRKVKESSDYHPLNYTNAMVWDKKNLNKFNTARDTIEKVYGSMERYYSVSNHRKCIDSYIDSLNFAIDCLKDLEFFE